jgi:hypothetical protein
MVDETKSASAFVAGDEIDTLTFDFTRYAKEAKGVIPEPTAEKLRAFQKGLKAVIRESLKNTKEPPANETQLESMKRIIGADDTDELAVMVEARTFELISDLCSGTPSVEQLQKIPYRVQQAFVGWLTGIFLNPES